ncbi:hypothetical protein BJD99_00255 [Rhodococcus sp. 1163]|uniref:hypothetical protein n=1 Tax=Rhodococcus sp. 1163 TaxID=1905289 RepID=UPI0009FBFCFA|nr:hypothetical protein [Rhodococcus sp. 1163]ORI19568.1 hypothetical protein BJD99_00255 [Rhodococcus sp. 1163]
MQRIVKAKIDALGWFPTLSGSLPQDDFNRTGPAPVATSVGTKVWVQPGSSWIINGNQLSAENITGTAVIYCETGLSDLTVEADLAAIGAGAANAQGGLAIRVSDLNNFWWLSTRRTSTGQGYHFFKYQAGVAIAMGTSLAEAVTAPKRPKIFADGPVLIGYVAGVEVARVTDASFNQSATGAGFMGAAAGVGHRWDNFATTA